METEVPNLTGRFPQADHWISNHFLNSLFGPRYDNAWKQAAITFLFRTQTALRAYEVARDRTVKCAASFSPGRPASALYFEAVACWETVVINIQIVLDLYLKFMDPQAVETDDATRIRLAANRIKHFADDIHRGSNDGELTLPLWLEKRGICTRTANVSFEELAENLIEMGKAADLFQHLGSSREEA